MCLLERHEERLKSIDTDIQIDDYNSLYSRKGRWLGRSFSLATSSHHKKIKAESAVSKEKGSSRVKLPKVSVPTFVFRF